MDHLGVGEIPEINDSNEHIYSLSRFGRQKTPLYQISIAECSELSEPLVIKTSGFPALGRPRSQVVLCTQKRHAESRHVKPPRRRESRPLPTRNPVLDHVLKYKG